VVKNNGRFVGLFFAGVTLQQVYLYRGPDKKKIVFNCIQQLIEPDTFS